MREAEVASEVRKRGEEVVAFHLSSRVPFCASWSGMVIPVTSLPCGEKNLLALPQISCKSERRSDSPPVSHFVNQPASIQQPITSCHDCSV